MTLDHQKALCKALPELLEWHDYPNNCGYAVHKTGPFAEQVLRPTEWYWVMHEAEKIYQEYPKKVGKPKALAAIRKQLQSYSAEHLLSATARYAAKWAGATEDERKYCPHPATWFNQERFNDDPLTWRPNATKPATKTATALPRDLAAIVERSNRETEAYLKRTL